MTLSIFYDHILNAARQAGASVEEILAEAYASGIRSAELDLIHITGEEDHLAMLSRSGIGVSCVNCFYTMENGFDRVQAEAHIDAALASGSQRILVVPGFLAQEDSSLFKKAVGDRDSLCRFLDSCDAALRIADGLRMITEMATQKGIQVTIEDFDDPRSPVSSLYSLLWFFDRIPELKCTFDTGNFITHSEDPLAAWEILKHKTVHIHCKDRGTGPVAVGDGHIPISGLLNRIRLDGYQGSIAIEHYGADNQLRCMKRSAAYILNNF